MDFAAPRTELSLASGPEERLSARCAGSRPAAMAVLTFNTRSRRDVCNEVWMVVIARNLVRSLCR
jgi:hypothetical protein